MPHIIVIDPGHGGTEEIGGSSPNNAVSPTGVLEKDMTLEMARLVQASLLRLATSTGQAIEVVLTRDSDVNLGLSARANLARDTGATRFLSIHYNGFNGEASGIETLISPQAQGNVNYAEDHAFATAIQTAALYALQAHAPDTKDRGVKEQSLGVLNDAALGGQCLACLVELEFIDVPAVDDLLNCCPEAPAIRRHLAAALAWATLQDLASEAGQVGAT